MSKIRAVKIVLLASVFNLIAYAPFAGTSSVNIPQKLTTHNADDFQPSVSPDGKMAAFVSNRNGNNDIWLVPLNGGTARQLTLHTASDTDPAWSRDGKRLAYTSLRDDSKGDIWLLDLDGNTETRLTDSRASESHPSWFPDGKRLAFSRGDDVWSIEIQSRKEERLFKGLYPSVSPDGKHIAYVSFEGPASSIKGKGSIYLYNSADGKTVPLTHGEFSDAFPSWSPDCKEVLFSRFSEDANGDGAIDIKDNPSIWKTSLTSSPSQLTSGAYYDLFPSTAADGIVYASSRGKDLDIYRISKDGEIPGLKTAGEQLEQAYKIKGAWPAILAFRKVYLTKWPAAGGQGDEMSIYAEAQYRTALTYLEISHRKDAVREFKSLISSFPEVRRYVSLAKIEPAKINAADAVSAGNKGAAQREMDELKGIIEGYKDQPNSQAAAQLEIGNICLSLKDDIQALREYEKVRGQYPAEVGAVALARLKMADIYASYGDELRIVDTYVSIIRDYPDSLEWCITASQKVLSLIEKMEDEKERLSGYRRLVSKFKGLPYLPALAQYKAGEFYQTRGMYDEAISEYRRVIDDFPSERSVVDEASIAMAEVWLAKGTYGSALSIYERLIKKGDARATRLYIGAALEKGRSEILGKEPAQAIKTYRSVIDLEYNEVRAHRGLIEAYAMKGEPEKGVAIYTEEIKRSPDSDTAHYILGLAFTYLNPPALNAAETEIKAALAINYSLPFAHQTLGWIYEIRDKTENGKTMGQAVDEYMTALALFQPEQKKETSDLLLNIGNGYSALGNHKKGYEFYKKRLESRVPFDDRRREAVYYENMGNEASRVGRYEEAAPYYQKALSYAKKIKDRRWELKITEETALLYQEAKDHARAADYFNQALKISEEEKMEDKKAALLRNIAYNQYHAGRVDEAIKYFNMSLDALNVREDLAKETGGLLTIKKALSLGKEGSESYLGFEKTGEEKLIYSYLGKAYAESGEYESALDGLLKKLELIPKEKDTERGIVLNNIGFLYYQMGEPENAHRYFKDSMEVARKAKNFTGEMVNIINIGLLATQDDRGEVASPLLDAIALQEKGVSLAGSEKRGKEYLPYLKNNLGLLYLKAGVGRGVWPYAQKAGWAAPTDLNLTIKTSLDSISHDRDYLKKAVAEFTEGLNDIGKTKGPWLEAALELNLATSLYQLGKDKEASDHLSAAMKSIETNYLADLKWRALWLLSYLENKNKVKRLEDAVAALEGPTPPNPLFSKEGAPKAGELAAAQMGQPQGSPLQTDLLYKELIYIHFSNGNLDDAFTLAERMAWNRTRSEAVKARFPMPKEEAPLSARDVQWLLDEKTALVRYMMTDRGLLIWFVDADNVRGKVVKISERGLMNSVSDLVSSLNKKDKKDNLSTLVIDPISSLLTGKKRLYIMADDALSSVPFAALTIGSELLIDRFEIAYAPSAYTLNAAYEQRNLNKVNILISQAEGYSDSYVEEIGAGTPIFAALKSDKTKFLDMASNYGMIHITDAVSISKTAPFRSSVDFRNGRLFLSELMQLRLNPGLVVITNVANENIMTPLILSGSPSVLVKTIPGDRDTEEILMKAFYNAYRKESASGALAAAQRELKGKGLSPGAWAGYSLYGYAGMNQEEERKYASRKVADIMNSAIDAYSKGEWKAAIKRFEEGLLFLKTIGAKEDLGNIYQALANAGANSGDNVKGAYYQEEYIRSKAGKLSKPEIAEAYRTLGVLYSRAGEEKKAEGALIEALKIWKETGNKKSISAGYRTLALLQEKGGSYGDAISSFNAALTIDRELKDDASAAQDLWEIGRINYLRLSRYDEAMNSYKEALSLFRGIRNREKTAKLLLDIGLVYEQGGEYESAKNHYLEGIKIADEISDRSGYSRGNLYIANVAWHTGDYQEAFRYQKIALATAVELKDRKQEAMAHNLAGLTYMNLGILEKALESLSKSLSISTETGDRLDAAAAHNNIGIVERELGELDKSIEGFKNALSIDTELKTKWGMAYDFRNLGISYERMGRRDDALKNLQSSLSMSREIGERNNEAMTLYSLGMLYVKSGKEAEASRTLKEAYIIGRELNLPEVTWRSLKAQATLDIKVGRAADAYQEMKEAIDIVEKMRGRIKVDEYKSGFLENKSDLYEEMVTLLLRMGRNEEAFDYSERGRSRNFIDMLGNQKVNLKSDASRRLLDAERRLKVRIDNLEERGRGNAALQEELTKARKEYEALLIEIKEESPELAAFVTVAAPSLREIQKSIPKDTAILEYMVTKDEIVIWTLGRERIESTIVPIAADKLKEKVIRYRELMEQVAPVDKESAELYNLLIRPVERLIYGTRSIGIIPHDVLHYLSFSSLFDGKQYLMEAHPIFYSPSAGVLKMITTRRNPHPSPLPEGEGEKMLVIGNPDLGDSAFDLPFAEREAGSIAREFEGSELLLRKEATETKVKEDIGRFDAVHFASHGVYDSITPLFSTLKLARDSANDGNLTANEVFSLDLKAKLIMMSACQTGLGKLTTGDEIIGLNRAFIYAGAPSIISTLWRINDAASAMLVKRFYRNYKNLNIAESLRQAQMAVKEYYPHPAYWAGFGLTGQGEQ